MYRLDAFETSMPENPRMHKSLRTHAREAAEFLTGRMYLPPGPPKAPLKKPGRGVSGESGN